PPVATVVDRSTTMSSWPCCSSAIAALSPPIPAPTTTTRTVSRAYSRSRGTRTRLSPQARLPCPNPGARDAPRYPGSVPTSHARPTKIAAPVGPASATLVPALVRAGMDGARLNFSHGTQDAHAERARLVREVQRETGKPLALIADLQGPKLRIGDLSSPLDLT